MDQNGMTTSEWLDVIDSLERVGPNDYERVNELTTFGLVDRWRRRVASLAQKDDVVLEIGAGPGNFTRHLVSDKVYCLEPSKEFSKPLLASSDPDRVTIMKGIGEKIPLADASVDKVFCVFSFRDFFDREASASEIFRVLKASGEVVIADIAKPPPGPLAKMIELHFRHIVPVLARVAIGPSARQVWDRDPYAKLMETYKAYGTPETYERLLSAAGFASVSTEYLDLKGATMTRGKKPWKSTS